jgi:hypothetical protein
MNVFVLRILQLAPFVATLAAVHPDAEIRSKECTRSPTGTLYAIDGVIRPGMTDAEMRQEIRGKTFLYDTLCMDPQDSTFNRRKHGYWVISAWTKDGPGPHVLLALDHIRYEQDRHFRQHGKYMISSAQLVLPQGMERVRVTLRGFEQGWIATTTMSRLMQTCTMFDGRVSDGAPAIQARRVACSFDEQS